MHIWAILCYSRTPIAESLRVIRSEYSIFGSSILNKYCRLYLKTLLADSSPPLLWTILQKKAYEVNLDVDDPFGTVYKPRRQKSGHF